MSFNSDGVNEIVTLKLAKTSLGIENSMHDDRLSAILLEGHSEFFNAIFPHAKTVPADPGNEINRQAIGVIMTYVRARWYSVNFQSRQSTETMEIYEKQIENFKTMLLATAQSKRKKVFYSTNNHEKIVRPYSQTRGYPEDLL